MWKQYIANQLLKAFDNLEFGSMTVKTPDGRTHHFSGPQPGPHGTFNIHDWRTVTSFASKGDIGLTEAYRKGWWETDNLPDLLTVGLMNEEALESFIYGSIFGRLASRILYLFRQNSVKGSKKNIHAHYDLGNDFYSLWLDAGMSYSSAIFRSENEVLEIAQDNKYDRIIDRLESTSGNLLEVGCGWGGFAQRAIERNDYALKGITLSEEQHAYANQRLGNQAEIVLEDYRHQKGKYQNIVSIEMFEAVGEKFWPTYFSKMNSLLDQKGKAVVQTITIGEKYFERYRVGGDMIRTYIFPGGMLPSVERFRQEAGKADLRVTDKFAFGKDYAETLRRWLISFEQKLPEVRSLGFDESFIRIWRFYLAACIASFSVGRTDVVQMELQHA